MKIKTNRLYQDLSWLWPMWGSIQEYKLHCTNVVRLIKQHAEREVRSLLNIGCGAGKNVYNLKRYFSVTGIDISLDMLEIAGKTNPECRFHQADMREFSLNEQYDAILIDDAISYMTTAEDLKAVFCRAYDHLRPGGVMICGPDETKETFVQNQTAVAQASEDSKPKHLDIAFIENTYDPDPNDTVYETMMIFLIREHGKLRIEHDLHILGLFPLETWRNMLRDTGFKVFESLEDEEDREYVTFACVKTL